MSEDGPSVGIIMLLIVIIFILFVNMIISAIAADSATSKDQQQRSKTCSTAAAVTAGLSVFGLVLFLVLYIYNSGDDAKGKGSGFYGEDDYVQQKAEKARPAEYLSDSPRIKPTKPPPILPGQKIDYGPDGPEDDPADW